MSLSIHATSPYILQRSDGLIQGINGGYIQSQLPDVEIQFVMGQNDLDFYRFLGENDALPELSGVAVSGKVEIAPGGCTFIVL